MLITPTYLEEQRKLHAKGGFGVSSSKYASLIYKSARNLGCESILDYGAGTGMLAEALAKMEPAIPVAEYDPAIPGKEELGPIKKYDMVVCSDVLEHVEPECIDDVLKHIASVTNKCLFVIISTRLSENKFLSDGRNAHILLQHGGWWQRKLEGVGFTIVDRMTKIAPRQDKHFPDEWRALCAKVVEDKKEEVVTVRKNVESAIADDELVKAEPQEITYPQNKPMRRRSWRR